MPRPIPYAAISGDFVQKTVDIVFPAPSKSENPITKTLAFGRRDDFARYCSIEKVSLFDPSINTVVLAYELLVPGRLYFADSARITAQRQRDHRTFEQLQAESINLERSTAMAVKLCLDADARIHQNIKVESNGRAAAQYNAVVVHGKADEEKTAYIVESARSPQPKDVERLLEKVETFKAWAPSSELFKTVTQFVPILGGQIFSDATIQECISHKVSRVAPSGAHAGYELEWIRDERR
jgi:hypothetical protein